MRKRKFEQADLSGTMYDRAVAYANLKFFINQIGVAVDGEMVLGLTANKWKNPDIIFDIMPYDIMELGQ